MDYGKQGCARACDPERMGRIGRVEVVCGPMFAGKTEELLRRVRRAVIAGRRVVVIGHALDTRHGADRVASHIGVGFPALAAARPEDIEAVVPDGTDVVAIDEAQFFGPGLLPVVGAARGPRAGGDRRGARRDVRRRPVRAARRR